MTDINELIDMAWSDDVTFSDIEKATGLKESKVKRIMQDNLKPSSYKLWRNRVRWIKEKRKKISNEASLINKGIREQHSQLSENP